MNAPSTDCHAWLWLVVALQVAIPASYYLRGTDRDDERFAWRMFSAVRVKRCKVSLAERHGASWREVELDRALHASWKNALGRGRKRVIQRLLEARCEGGPSEVELTRSCKTANGERLPVERTRRRCGGPP